MDINKLLEDSKFVDYVINKFLPFSIVYKMLDEDYKDRGNNFCIFHDNTDTPAARVYHNEDGDALYCYSENKRYRPSHAFRMGIINHRIESVAYNILKQFDNAQIQALVDDYGKDLEVKPTFSDDEILKLKQFKLGKISVKDFNKLLINIIYLGG
jgi:hypothetical protein